MEEWEPDATGSRTGALLRILAFAGIVVLVGVLVRSPATTTDPTLVVDPSPPVAATDPGPGAPIGLRGGTWTTVGARPDIDLLRPGPSVWTGEELLVGFSPRVAAWSPDRSLRQAWRSVPPHPGGALQVRGAVALPGSGVLVYGVKACAGCGWEPSLWRLAPATGRWARLLDAPGPADAVREVVLEVAGRLVVVRDLGDDGLRVLVHHPAPPSRMALAPGRWDEVRVPTTGPTSWEAVAADDQLVLVGSVAAQGGPSEPVVLVWDMPTRRWTDRSDGVPLSAPEQATAVWTGAEVVLFGAGASPAAPRGAALDPRTGTWTPLPALPPGDPALPDVLGTPAPLDGLVGLWDGDRAVFLGGLSSLHVAWSPAEGAWQVRWPPAPRSGGTAWWTGRQVLAWGGVDRRGPVIDLSVWPARPSGP